MCYRKSQERDYRHLLMVPSRMRRDILTSCHDGRAGGHFGYTKTLVKVQSRFLWPKICRSVKAYVASCRVCQFNKPMSGAPIGLLQSISSPKEPFETIGVDNLGPFKCTVLGNFYLVNDRLFSEMGVYIGSTRLLGNWSN